MYNIDFDVRMYIQPRGFHLVYIQIKLGIENNFQLQLTFSLNSNSCIVFLKN
jgi:hypothetical protein